MIPNRESSAESPNDRLRALAPLPGERNVAWLARAGVADGIVLLGGSSLADVRLRFAQSALRSDLSPSYWSTCGILADGSRIYTVPLAVDDVSSVPYTNGVREWPVEAIDDPEAWPNIGVLRFTEASDRVLTNVQRVRDRRTIVDLPRLIVAWLGWTWAVAEARDPLANGIGVPAAAFVETVYSLADIELTPGLASAASCPEAIWQAVKWWHEFYAEAADLAATGDAAPIVPEGAHGLRQRSAAARLAPDAPLFMPPPGGSSR